MIWRLSRAHRADTALTGIGSAIKGGRWNSPGNPVVYTSANLSLAILEILVNTELQFLPALELVAFSVEIPDPLVIETYTPSNLPPDWRQSPCPLLREMGDRWLTASTTAVLQVPSAVVPQESNYLLNPNHPDFDQLVIGQPEPFSLDERLWA